MENITVCVRIKPTTGNENNPWRLEGNSIVSAKSKEIFNFGGINLSIFAYGQTSTGKTFTMKGSHSKEGIIPLSLKEIFSKLEKQAKEVPGFRYSLKGSYLEIYNETVNDLLDSSKKSLEIRESLSRGVFVNQLTEVNLDSYYKVNELLRQGDNIKVTAETKLNEKSSRSHSIFRISLETSKLVNNKHKTLVSQLNLIDLAGSENVSKAKTDGIRMKEGSNINKSLLALSNVINKLSTNPKSFVNYRDSKLTRLLQPALSGNSKTMIVCTISETNSCYSETNNTLHFGTKAKNVKTTIKVNELLDEKNKIISENATLKDKIKQLEEVINEKKAAETSVVHSTSDQISTLEREVNMLKKILLNNEDGENDGNSEILSTNSNHLRMNLNHSIGKSVNPLLMSGQKYNRNSSMLMSSGKKMTDSARKLSSLNRSSNFFNEPELAHAGGSVFRRCMTDMKTGFAPSVLSNAGNGHNYNVSSYFSNTAQKKYSQGLHSSAYKNPNPLNLEQDFDFLHPSSGENYMALAKENEDLRKNLYDMRKNYIDTISSKDNQIKSLNYNLNLTMDNCEKLIREAEDNYMNLKLNYERTREDMLNKENEIKNLNQKIRHLEENNVYSANEISRLNTDLAKMNDNFKQDEIYKELEQKLTEITKSYQSLNALYEGDKGKLAEALTTNEKLSSENDKARVEVDSFKSEIITYKTENEKLRKNYEIILSDNRSLRNDVDSYKNELGNCKEKLSKTKAELSTLFKRDEKAGKALAGRKTTASEEHEKKIAKQAKTIGELEGQVKNYKESLDKIQNTQIAEYQKLLDESFKKISELQDDLEKSKERKAYYEENSVAKKQLDNKSTENKQTPIRNQGTITRKTVTSQNNKNSKHISQFSFAESEAPASLSLKSDNVFETGKEASDNNEFIGKKRKYLPKVYQSMVEKNLAGKDEAVESLAKFASSKREKENKNDFE